MLRFSAFLKSCRLFNEIKNAMIKKEVRKGDKREWYLLVIVAKIEKSQII